MEKRDALTGQLGKRFAQKMETELFTIRWRVERGVRSPGSVRAMPEDSIGIKLCPPRWGLQ